MSKLPLQIHEKFRSTIYDLAEPIRSTRFLAVGSMAVMHPAEVDIHRSNLAGDLEAPNYSDDLKAKVAAKILHSSLDPLETAQLIFGDRDPADLQRLALAYGGMLAALRPVDQANSTEKPSPPDLGLHTVMRVAKNAGLVDYYDSRRTHSPYITNSCRTKLTHEGKKFEHLALDTLTLTARHQALVNITLDVLGIPKGNIRYFPPNGTVLRPSLAFRMFCVKHEVPFRLGRLHPEVRNNFETFAYNSLLILSKRGYLIREDELATESPT